MNPRSCGIIKTRRVSVREKLITGIRGFLRIDRDIDNIKRDITAIESRELDRDEQYPLEDKQALPPDQP